MTVHFVGAGPGAPDLLTLRAARLMGEAKVILYAGSLVTQEVLVHACEDADLIDTADLDLDAIIARLAEAHSAGHDVVRLHSGDPSVFSAVAEQARRLDELHIPWDIVPGVPSFAAAAAALRQELTLPTVGQTVILTRIASQATPMPVGEDLATLGKSGALLVLHLAVQHSSRLVEELLPSYGPDCPIAVVEKVSWPQERVIRGALKDLVALVADAGIKRTALVFVGAVLGQSEFSDSHLYSAARDRGQ